MKLVEFLTARLDDDEERARFVQSQIEGEWHKPFETWRLSWHDEYDLLCIEPERALREVEAKRAIAQSADEMTVTEYAGVGDRILAHLATVYSDHPDYDAEWRA